MPVARAQKMALGMEQYIRRSQSRAKSGYSFNFKGGQRINRRENEGYLQ